ncbi:MAG: MBL fold metallo-hydrolase [Actinomycetota bacterium]|jgi:ribonuclease BN (tRNA processing enzyme)|nr:MBL fold metallo-hydrolase [Actinomycetota bacterium]
MKSATTRLVLLGTAGGPLPSPIRMGISQAVVVGGRVHVIDCGSGVTRQLRRAKLLSALHQVFITHLHSDHVCDYFNLFLCGWPILQWNPPVHVFGPGSAGGTSALPPERPDDPPIPVVVPAHPTPGLVEHHQAQLASHAYDINIRMREAGRFNLSSLVVPHEIVIPPEVGAEPPERVAPPMEPLLVSEDDHVRVTAILVSHPPVFPAFAYRFDTDQGSIVISGDTTPSPNLVTLARGADILVHEVFTDKTSDLFADDEDDWEARRRQHHLVSSHTPLSQVGAVAAEAGVRRLVLTHFIPGYDEVPDERWVKGAGADFDGEVVVGHDLLEVRL